MMPVGSRSVDLMVAVVVVMAEKSSGLSNMVFQSSETVVGT